MKDLPKPASEIPAVPRQVRRRVRFVGNDGDRFYVMTDKDAPRRRVVAIDTGDAGGVGVEDASSQRRPGATCWQATSMVANRFVTQWMTDAHEVLKVYALDGAFET